MLVDLTVKEFLNKVAGSDPVPGGGSIAALNGAVASALAAMVANLTIGKKGYEEHEELMKHISEVALQVKDTFIGDIDRDSEAYDSVFACFKMPKATDEEKAARSAAIQEATKFAGGAQCLRTDDRHYGRSPPGQPQCRNRCLRGNDVGPLCCVGSLDECAH